MGSLISSEQSEDNLTGYHILQVQENSPAQDAGLEEFFDFITAVHNIELIDSDEVFLSLLRRNISQPTPLRVYSLRTNDSREVYINPKPDWGGSGILGLTTRFSTVKEALNNVRHILKVFPGSPAEIAGLKPFTDYIIGTDLSNTSNEESFANFIKKFDQKTLNLFVYNIEDASCRRVQIIPNTNWGGSGAIGCAIGSGLLHKIPASANLQTPLSIARYAVNSIVDAVVAGSKQKSQVKRSDVVELELETRVASQSASETEKTDCNVNEINTFHEGSGDMQNIGDSSLIFS